jgi:nucleoside recognition membrane protein YjiH
MVIFSFNVTCKNLSVSAQTSLILKSISFKIIKAQILRIYKITEKNKYDFIKFLEISFAEPISGVKLIPNYSTH